MADVTDGVLTAEKNEDGTFNVITTIQGVVIKSMSIYKTTGNVAAIFISGLTAPETTKIKASKAEGQTDLLTDIVTSYMTTTMSEMIALAISGQLVIE